MEVSHGRLCCPFVLTNSLIHCWFMSVSLCTSDCKSALFTVDFHSVLSWTGSWLCRFNFGNLGFWFPWSMVLLVIAAGFFTYVTVLMVRRWGFADDEESSYLRPLTWIFVVSVSSLCDSVMLVDILINSLFTLLQKVGWEDRYHSCLCVNMEPGGD